MSVIVQLKLLRAPLLALVLWAGTAAPARASSPPPLSVGAPVLLADDFSWSGFARYWKSFASRTDRVVLVVVLVMVAALFIITRGKWLK